MATWHTPHSARAFWKDAAGLSDETVAVYLTVAAQACLAFAPLPDLDPEEIPENYRLAQVMHARNIHNAVQNGGGAQQDQDTGFVIMAPAPLDWHIRQLLRPVTAWGAIA
ncbi:hypothetical protein RWH45_10625 [Microbacterium sp. KSW4-17]|uniref:Phage gp6-like head-tail connector protein n=1 Tax=Microbacterium galbum TaxID=3075994 RepID=A0ABU3T8G2_9MICO|nr:hypothetical protein [Microbacterium sp. KSW4-17]MDU0367672.1 hypothetical protein [Microbacterium sp. KSW4-17]